MMKEYHEKRDNSGLNISKGGPVGIWGKAPPKRCRWCGTLLGDER